MAYNIIMMGFLIYFISTTLVKACCSTRAYVYPVTCDTTPSDIKGYDVGKFVEYISVIYLFLTLLSVTRCFYTMFVTVRSGWRKNVYVGLNTAQLVTNLMFFVILIIRFMFSVRVCFCDFKAPYYLAMETSDVDTTTIEPSP